MVTIGVVLLVLAVLLGVDLVLENSGTTDVMIMGQMLSFDVWGLFVLGVASGVLVVAGVQFLAAGLVRDRRKAKERRQALLAAAAAEDTSGFDAAPTVPLPPVVGRPPAPSRAPSSVPAPEPVTAPRHTAPGGPAPASAAAPFVPVTDATGPRPGPFDRVVARKRDKPDQPTAAL